MSVILPSSVIAIERENVVEYYRVAEDELKRLILIKCDLELSKSDGDSEVPDGESYVRIEDDSLLEVVNVEQCVPKVKKKLTQTYNCQFEGCDKLYASKNQLKVHERIHTGQRPYQCPTCPKTFITSYSLKTHTRTHTGETPYKCNTCSKQFKSSGDLQKHLRVHTGERPFPCPQCDKSFTLASIRKVHLRLHTGERPYKCDLCNKTFVSATNFKNHKRIHTGEKPYKCQVKGCYRDFTEYSSLYKHRVVHIPKTNT